MNLDKGNETRTEEHRQEEFDPKKAMEAMDSEPKLNKFVVKQFEAMKKIEAERSALNDQIKAVRSQIEVKGIPLDAIKMAYRLYKMDLDKVQEAVIGMALCMKATNQPIQIDFLDSNISKIH